eukprot:651061_1
MKRKPENTGKHAAKKQRTEPAFCKFECGHICDPGVTKKGNPFDTCCKRCAQAGKTTPKFHSWDCNQRIYKYKIEIGEVEPVDDWDGMNKRIVVKVEKEIGTVIRDSLPTDFVDHIKDIVIQFVTPKFVPRPYWIPQTEEKEDAPLTASKYGGKPWLKHNETWPKCGSCSNYMPLFVQLNINDLPHQYKEKYLPKAANGELLWKDHLVQLFYCANSEDCDAGYEAFNTEHKQRVIRIGAKEEHKDDVYLDGIMKIIQEKAESRELQWESMESVITRWNKSDDIEGAMYEIEDELETLLGKGICFDDETFGVGVLGFVENHFLNEEDKLFGYPAFINDMVYPVCCEAECDERLRGMIFQTDAQVLEFCWSDVGVGQILYCPNHPFTVGFTWQSS